MEIFLLALVTLRKTQFVSRALSARFHRPWPVLAGGAAASIANHGLAAIAGLWVSSLLLLDNTVQLRSIEAGSQRESFGVLGRNGIRLPD